MDRLTLEAPAKLNLRLLVGPRSADGYHPLESLMIALDGLADTVHARLAPGRAVICPGIEGPANLAWRALDELEREVGRPLPLEVRIDKRIPAQAGLGGGSSDAAAVLRAADALYGLELGPARLEAVAARVGSDVPFFVRGGCQWARGRGELLEPAAAPRFAALLAMPGYGLSTGAVYAAFDRMAAPPPGDGRPAPVGLPELARWVRNDLWPPALAMRPALGAVARALRAAGAEVALLCGSGSAVAGLFADEPAAERARPSLAGMPTAVVRAPR